MVASSAAITAPTVAPGSSQTTTGAPRPSPWRLSGQGQRPRRWSRNFPPFGKRSLPETETGDREQKGMLRWL